MKDLYTWTMAALVVLFLGTTTNAQIIAWELNGNAGNEVTVNATTNNANLNTSTLSRGGGVTASSLGNAFSANNWNETSQAAAITANDYYQFEISATAGFEVSLSTLDVNFRRSSTGPTDFQWQYSLDGFATAGSNAGAAINYTSNPTNGTAQTQIDLSVIPALQNVGTGTTITFRLFGWNASAATGTFAIGRLAGDDLAIGGSVNATSSNTSVEFATTASTAVENSGTTNLVLEITNFDATNATNVTITATGATGRITTHTSPVIFPANDGSDQNCTVTLDNNAMCDGSDDVIFTITAVTGGMGTPTIGTNSVHTLTVSDDEATTTTLAFQGFESTTNDDWSITAGGANVSSADGSLDFPANERILNGSNSWQVNNGTATLDLGTVTTTGISDVVIKARLSSTALTSGNGADASDQVDVFVDLDAGGFPVSPDIRINGFSNTRYGYSTGTPATASTTAGTPVTLTTSGNDYTFIEVLIPGGTNSVALRITALNNNANEIWNIDNVSIEGTFCKTVYYSRGSGDVTDNIWSTTRMGAAAAASFGRTTDMVIQSGDVVDLSTSEMVCRFYSEAGGEFNGEPTGVLTSVGDTISGEGVIGGDDGDWAWNIYPPSGNTFLVGAGDIEFGSLNVLGGGAVDQSADRIKIRRELTVEGSSTYNAGSDTIALISDADGTARIGDVSGGTFTATAIEMQRFIPAGVTNWRLLGTSIAGKNLASWNDDFLTAGFPGSDVPWFDNPTGSGILWPSVRWYDETFVSANLLDTLRGPTGTGQALTPGQGFAVWCGDNMAGTGSFVIDNYGTVNSGPIVLPMTYTSTGNSTIDGHNLVSNPLPSPIDFGLISLGADVENFYHVYDPVAGNNDTWDETLGTSVLGGLNGNIQSMQGFWLKANGAAVTTTVDDADKVLDHNGGGLFGGTDLTQTLPVFRLKISSNMNNYFDAALVAFNQGDADLGAGDITKLTFQYPDAPQISTESADGYELVINDWGSYNADISIPVRVAVPISGDYTITVYNAQNLLGRSCLVLEDLQTGTSTPLVEGAAYTFSANTGDAVTPARFLVHVSEPIERTSTDVTCAGANDGTATVTGAGNGPWDVTWMDAVGNVIQQQNQVTGATTITGLNGGNYSVSVVGNGTCGTVINDFVIDEPALLDATSSMNNATCDTDADGDIFIETMGGSEPYTYLWSNGGSTEDLLDVAAGTYDLTITDGNGCTKELTGLDVLAGPGPTAMFAATSTSVVVNEEVEFYPVFVPGATYAWDMGDGTSSNDFEPSHQYTLPGVYTVTLIVTQENCSNTFDITVDVSTASNVGEFSITGLNAYSVPGAFVITWDMESNSGMQVQVFDAMGRSVVANRALPGVLGMLRLNTDDLSDGMYLLRMTEGEKERVFTLPHFRN